MNSLSFCSSCNNNNNNCTRFHSTERVGRCSVVVIDEHSTLPEASIVGSDCIVWCAVCSVVVGASQSIVNTSEGLLLGSEMMSNNGHV